MGNNQFLIIQKAKDYDYKLTKALPPHSKGKLVKEIWELPDQWQVLFSPSIVMLLGYWRPPSANQMLIKISASIEVSNTHQAIP